MNMNLFFNSTTDIKMVKSAVLSSTSKVQNNRLCLYGLKKNVNTKIQKTLIVMHNMRL